MAIDVATFSVTLKQHKKGFFDRKAVLDYLKPREAAFLSRFGAGTRQTAQKSIKMGDRPSAPGSPPRGHKSGVRKRVSKSTGKVRHRGVSLLREFILFSLKPGEKSVITGPAKLPGMLGRAPAALEYGGVSVVRDRKKVKPVRIRARPFMRPAFADQLGKLPANWASSIK